MHAFKITLLGLILSVHLQCTSRADERPNIIVILADDLGRGDYSAFGTPDIRTPAIVKPDMPVSLSLSPPQSRAYTWKHLVSVYMEISCISIECVITMLVEHHS
jgi:hypothetical protein